jgi:hypothetical protein
MLVVGLTAEATRPLLGECLEQAKQQRAEHGRDQHDLHCAQANTPLLIHARILSCAAITCRPLSNITEYYTTSSRLHEGLALKIRQEK